MAKRVCRNFLCILSAMSGLLFMTGCPATSDPSWPAGLSTTSTEVASFVQKFAREAIAAFLF